MSQNEDARELAEMVKEGLTGIKEELISQYPQFDLSPKQDPAKIKQAIMDITPDGMAYLFRKYGREPVMDFIREFGQDRRW